MPAFFNYSLPKERIAQFPLSLSGNRSDAKLLHARNNSDNLEIQDLEVPAVLEILKPGDLLILNNTKVLPVRFFTNLTKEIEVEVFLLEKIPSLEDGSEDWLTLARPMKKFKEGMGFKLSSSINAEVLGRDEEGRRLKLRLKNSSDLTMEEVISKEGTMPIPVYIRDGHALDYDKELYQTVFAKEQGSVAAPTAGLHFTKELLAALKERGVNICFITLHVGFASILPVENPDSHQMAYESYVVTEETITAIQMTKESGGRIAVVGTTSTRALESMAIAKDFVPGEVSQTNLFIRSGFDFKIVDLLFTNFHQPQSTHLLLVAAFMGEENIEKIYQHALKNNYRFLSYGDTMLLEPKE